MCTWWGGYAAPTGITQVAGVGLIGLGIGAVGFGGAKTVDAIAALVHDTPKHDIPSSYGDLAGTATDKALGGDGQVGGIVGSLGEGLVGVGLIKVGAKAAPPLIKSLGPLFVSAVDDATIGVNMMSTTATILDKSNLIDKKATDAQPSKQKDKEALGGSGGLPAPQGRNEY